MKKRPCFFMFFCLTSLLSYGKTDFEPTDNPIIKHTAEMENKIQKLTLCAAGTTCRIEVDTLLDFGVYYRHCSQLQNWRVYYSLSPNIYFILSSNAKRACLFELQDNAQAENPILYHCNISNEQIEQSAAVNFYATLHDIDQGKQPKDAIRETIKPIADCLNKPYAEFKSYQEIKKIP